jgi:hypothetical protein
MIDSARYNLYANDPAQFREDLLVECDGSVRRFGEVMDPWQRNDFAALDHAMRKCNGRTTKFRLKNILRAYFERSRGHSKTTDLAVICCWLLAFATRPLKGYAFAADKDQAALLKDAIETVIRLNPWLGKILEVQKYQVANIAKGHPGCGSRLEISTSDVGSSYGILPDFIIADELTHWQGDGSLWHSIISSAAKRRDCLLVVIANAGFVDSWQWGVREAARTSGDWYFSRLDGPVASWLSEKTLDEQRKMLPKIAYDRLWNNLWSTGGGDALTTEDIEAAFRDDLEPMSGNESGYYFVGGSDLGLTRDCAAFVVLAVPIGGKSGKIKLAHHKLWQPVPGRKINLLEVVRHILECDRKFKLQFIGFDPWQHEMMAQTLEADSNRKRRNSRRVFFAQPFMREIPPTPTNLRQQASLTIESFQDHRFQMYTCEPLRRDLHKLRVEEKNNSFRLVSPRDGHGHGDTASAFCLALLIAHELAGKKRVVLGGQKDNSYLTAIEKRMEADRREEEHLASKGKQDPSGLLEAMSNGQVNVVSQFRI